MPQNLMRVAQYERYGGPEVVQVTDVPMPQCKDNELIVRVHATTVNRTDCGFLRGKPLLVRLFSGLLKPRSRILGCEFCGSVEYVGKHVQHHAVGDRVVGFKDDDYGFGGHAQFTVVPVGAMLATIPENFTFAQAAPAFEGAHYALHYIRAADIRRGMSVLVNGATGAIGSAAVQLISFLGANVTAVCGGDYVDLVSELGADSVVDYRKNDFTQLPHQFDVVFDAVGKSSFGRCKKVMKANGIYMSTELGDYWQNPVLALFKRSADKQKVLFPIPSNSVDDAHYIIGLLASGDYRPLIDREFTLENIVDAFRYVEQGEKIGNVVISVA